MSFPPAIVVAVKALACELPSELGLPLSRLSMSELREDAIRRGLVASVGGIHHLALALRRRHPAVAPSQLDLPQGPPLC